MVEITITNGNKMYIPVVEDGVEWQTDRVGTPGKLTFKVHIDDTLKIEEGNHVRFRWNDTNIFYGFIFSKKCDKENVYTITAYDQLRYLKNKDTYVYENKTAGEVIKMIASDSMLQTGTIENTGYKIPSMVEDCQELFEIINNALDETLKAKSKMYVMYDDFGKINLKAINNMKLNILLDEETGENYDYTSSIDGDVYNQIKLYYDNEETKGRDIFVVKDNNNINKWGVLQLYESIEKGENGQAKAEALLKLYNAKTRKLSISKAFGDVRVRAGSMIAVMLTLADTKIQNYMLVESCKHTFKADEHMMDLTLKGGEFIA